MNSKYPDAYGTCYIDDDERVIGVVRRKDLERSAVIWHAEYLDGFRPECHPKYKLKFDEFPWRCQAELDFIAYSNDWRKVE